MALSGTATHLAAGELGAGVTRIAALGAGVLLGAQLGARVSAHVTGRWIMRGLALALRVVGGRLLYGALIAFEMYEIHGR